MSYVILFYLTNTEFVLDKYSAFIFDLNGTMIDDMPYHIETWHEMLTSLGANISREETKHQCYGKNEEILERIFPGRFSEEEKSRIGFQKEEKYQRVFKPYLKLNIGLHQFLEKSKRIGLRIGIGTAAIMFNVDYILYNLSLRPYFDSLISADNVNKSKPHPETFLKCAKELGVSSHQCLVFEDAPKGVETALNARMDCIVLTNLHSKNEFADFSNIKKFISDFYEIEPAELSAE